jgi:hypothetical protein
LAIASGVRQLGCDDRNTYFGVSILACLIELQHRLGAIDEVKPLAAFVAEGFQPQPRH